jgi:flagellar hook-associated protein 3 FlgL
MLRPIDSHSERFLADIRLVDDRLRRAQRELSSGKRVHNASDAPADLPAILASRTELGHMVQVRANLGRVKAEVDTAEEAVRHAVDALDHALAIGSQGATGTATAEIRHVLAGEIRSVIEQISSIAGTKVEGRYVFAGDQDQNIPYTLDFSQANPVSAYGGSASTRETSHPAGTRFQVARTAQQIFDSPDPAGNVFQSLVALRDSLEADDIDAVRDAVANVLTASEHVNTELAAYGNIQGRIAEATEFATRQELLLKVRLSSLEDADLVQAATDLNEATFLRQTAFQAEAQRPRQSLFDFIG